MKKIFTLLFLFCFTYSFGQNINGMKKYIFPYSDSSYFLIYDGAHSWTNLGGTSHQFKVGDIRTLLGLSICPLITKSDTLNSCADTFLFIHTNAGNTYINPNGGRVGVLTTSPDADFHISGNLHAQTLDTTKTMNIEIGDSHGGIHNFVQINNSTVEFSSNRNGISTAVTENNLSGSILLQADSFGIGHGFLYLNIDSFAQHNSGDILVLTDPTTGRTAWRPATGGGGGIDSSICNPKIKVDSIESCTTDNLILQRNSGNTIISGTLKSEFDDGCIKHQMFNKSSGEGTSVIVKDTCSGESSSLGLDIGIGVISCDTNSLVVNPVASYTLHNFGVGQSTPTARFDVLGSIKFESLTSGGSSDSVLCLDGSGNVRYKSVSGGGLIQPTGRVVYGTGLSVSSDNFFKRDTSSRDFPFVLTNPGNLVYNYRFSADTYITFLPWHGGTVTQGTFVNSLTPGGVAVLGGGEIFNSSNAQNDRIDWNFAVGGGTYKLSFIGVKASSEAIWTILIDGVSAGTLDFYNATTVQNTAASLTGISISRGGHTIGIKAATRNASSTGWFIEIAPFVIERTGP